MPATKPQIPSSTPRKQQTHITDIPFMSIKASASKLFEPIEIGSSQLRHRVVHAPLTRFRADDHHVQTDLVIKYYTQRASQPGTLLITEATLISPEAGGYDHVPGIWSDAQVAQWKKVTDAVHAQGSYMFVQLWALGRTAEPSVLEKEGPYPYIAPSPIAPAGQSATPREMTVTEIKQFVQTYAKAATNAVKAGFDGVEVHVANGYLPEQFLQDVSNQRTDEYGGSIENRARFPLEVLQAVVDTVGEKRVAFRISPWSEYNDMGMKDPMPQFSYFIKTAKERFPSLAYAHVVEPRIDGIANEKYPDATNDALRAIWKPKPYIAAGGFTREEALKTADTHGNLIAFGRMFIANPDLPLRLKNDWPVSKGNRDLYYTADSSNLEVGYTNYLTYAP